MGSSRSKRGEVVSTGGVLLEGMEGDDSCVDADGSARITEEGQSCVREERNLTNILRCCGEISS